MVCQNYFESLALSIICNGIEEAESIEKKHSGQIPNRPTMCFETYKELEDVLKENALLVEDAFSFPNLSYIGLREKITGDNYSISDVLKIDNNFDKILELEKRNIHKYKSKDRGLYIFVYARKE